MLVLLQLGIYSVSILVPDLGFSRLEAGTGTIVSTLNITSVTPSAGSVAGGTIITLIGSGFHSDTQQNVVTIGNKNCTVTASSYTSLSCCTSPQPHGLYSLKVIINGVLATSEYNHSISKTPTVTSITPNEGQHGNEVIVSGTKFSSVIIKYDCNDRWFTLCCFHEQRDGCQMHSWSWSSWRVPSHCACVWSGTVTRECLLPICAECEQCLSHTRKLCWTECSHS